MQNTYIARQAILDNQSNTLGYELLFRDSQNNNFPEIDMDVASSKLIIETHLHGDISKIANDKLAFINFTENCLVHKYPLVFNKDAIVIELVGDSKPTDRLLKITQYYAEKGYQIALSEYDLDKGWDKFFPFITLIKIDIEKINVKRLVSLVPNFRKFDIKLVAEKVETKYQQISLTEVGFDYFQGFYYHEPEIVEGKVLTPIKLQMVNLLSETFNYPLNFDNIANIISHDVNLTFSLLKMVNNVATGTKIEITSLKQAAAYLGESKLRQFVSILALSNLSTDVADELGKQALVTGQFMDALAKQACFASIEKYAFITGLLSAIEAMLGLPIDEIMQTMPLAAPIAKALVNNEGLLGELLVFSHHYIAGTSDSLHEEITHFSLNPELIQQAFVDACDWSNQLTKQE